MAFLTISFCKGVAQQVKFSGVSLSKLQSEEFEKKKIEKQLEEEERLMQSLYKAVEKVREEESDEEVDPKSILCEYYKQGEQRLYYQVFVKRGKNACTPMI